MTEQEMIQAYCLEKTVKLLRKKKEKEENDRKKKGNHFADFLQCWGRVELHKRNQKTHQQERCATA